MNQPDNPQPCCPECGSFTHAELEAALAESKLNDCAARRERDASQGERDRAVDELKQCRALLDSYDFHQTGIHNGIMAMNNRIQKLESDLRLFKAQHGE